MGSLPASTASDRALYINRKNRVKQCVIGRTTFRRAGLQTILAGAGNSIYRQANAEALENEQRKMRLAGIRQALVDP